MLPKITQIENAISAALGVPGVGRWRLALANAALIDPAMAHPRDVATLLFAVMASSPEQAAAAVVAGEKATAQITQSVQGDNAWMSDPSNIDALSGTVIDLIAAIIVDGFETPVGCLCVGDGGRCVTVTSTHFDVVPEITAKTQFLIDGYELPRSISVKELYDVSGLAGELQEILMALPAQGPAVTVSSELH